MIFVISQYLLNLNNQLYYLEKKSLTSLNDVFGEHAKMYCRYRVHLFVYCYNLWRGNHLVTRSLNLWVTPLHDALQSGPKFRLYIKLFVNIERIIICYFAFV